MQRNLTAESCSNSYSLMVFSPETGTFHSENTEQQSCKCQQGRIPLQSYTERQSRFPFDSELNSTASDLDLWFEVFFWRQMPLEN